MSAMLIRPDGTREIVQIPKGTLGQELLECRLTEVVPVDASLEMWCDEEGLMTADPQLNIVATMMRWELSGGPENGLDPNDFTVVGNALFVDTVIDGDGNMVHRQTMEGSVLLDRLNRAADRGLRVKERMGR